MLLRSEVKSQEKHVKALKKRCLWSKVLEEVHFFLPSYHIIACEGCKFERVLLLAINFMSR